MKITRWMKNVAERAARAAGIAYCVSWQAGGLDFDHLVTIDNGKAAVVGAALSLALSLGFKSKGDPESGGFY